MKVMRQMEIVFCRSIRQRQSNHRCVIAIVIQESLNPFSRHFKQMTVSFYSCADHRQWKSINNILRVVVIVTRETIKLFACEGLQSPILRLRVGNRSSILISSTEDNSETVVQAVIVEATQWVVDHDKPPLGVVLVGQVIVHDFGYLLRAVINIQFHNISHLQERQDWSSQRSFVLCQSIF